MSRREDVLTSSGLRVDSRLALELRSTGFSLSTVPSSADGQATARHGLTQVQVSVYGPREPSRQGAFSRNAPVEGKAAVNVEVTSAGWSSQGGQRRAGSGKDRRHQELGHALRSTFEPVLLSTLFPRSSVDIHVLVLSSDGSLLQAAVNATTLALIAAGVPLADYVCAVSVGNYPGLPATAPPQVLPPRRRGQDEPEVLAGEDEAEKTKTTTMLDLTADEERQVPFLTVGILPRTGKLSLLTMETRCSIERTKEMLRWGAEAAQVVRESMEQAIMAWAGSLSAPSQSLSALFPSAGKPANDSDELSGEEMEEDEDE